MWIFLSVIAFLALLITAILLLPIFVTIKIDEENDFYIRYKILHKTFGENPDPNNPIVKTLKNASGISRLEKKPSEESKEDDGLLETVKDNLSLITDLLKELLNLFKRCKTKTFKLKIICADENAADAAISYGECCAVVYPILGYLHSIINIRKRGKKIDISCDYNGSEGEFSFETVLVIRLFRVLGALFRTVVAEAKRLAAEQTAEVPTLNKNQK